MRLMLATLAAFVAAIAVTVWVGWQNMEVTHVDPDVIVVQYGDGEGAIFVRGKPGISIRGKVPKPDTIAPHPAAQQWSLPYSCEQARSYSARFSRAQLEAMRVAFHFPEPTAKQRAEIAACLRGQ